MRSRISRAPMYRLRPFDKLTVPERESFRRCFPGANVTHVSEDDIWFQTSTSAKQQSISRQNLREGLAEPFARRRRGSLAVGVIAIPLW